VFDVEPDLQAGSHALHRSVDIGEHLMFHRVEQPVPCDDLGPFDQNAPELDEKPVVRPPALKRCLHKMVEFSVAFSGTVEVNAAFSCRPPVVAGSDPKTIAAFSPAWAAMNCRRVIECEEVLDFMRSRSGNGCHSTRPLHKPRGSSVRLFGCKSGGHALVLALAEWLAIVFSWRWLQLGSMNRLDQDR